VSIFKGIILTIPGFPDNFMLAIGYLLLTLHSLRIAIFSLLVTNPPGIPCIQLIVFIPKEITLNEFITYSFSISIRDKEPSLQLSSR